MINFLHYCNLVSACRNCKHIVKTGSGRLLKLDYKSKGILFPSIVKLSIN